jgi:hypothetical protein
VIGGHVILRPKLVKQLFLCDLLTHHVRCSSGITRKSQKATYYQEICARMNLVKEKGKQKRIRPAEESQKSVNDDALITQRLRKWKRGTACLGIALAASVGSVVPFSKGHSLHEYSPSVGKVLVILSMCLLSAFMYAAGTTYNFWWYRRSMKKIRGG